jgi:ATP/maltotriose-dependent transcriptional regulator MalT
MVRGATVALGGAPNLETELEPRMARDTLTNAREAVANRDWGACVALVQDERFPEPVDEAARLDLLAEGLWWLGRVEDCIEARHGAYRAYEELGDHRRSGQCAVWLYEHHGFRARGAIATAWLQRARRALEDDVECVEHGALLLREAELAHGSGALDTARNLADQALALGRVLASANLEAEALQTIGRVLIDAGEVAGGLAHLDEAMLLAAEGRLGPYSTGKVYCSLISACEDLGDLRRAAEWTEATSKWADQHPFAIFPGICRIHRAAVLDRSGALADAEREASQACDELLGSHLANAAAAFAEVGDIRRRLGDLPRAEEAFARAEELTGQTCAGVALVRLAEGQVDAASRIITECMSGQSNRLARARLLPASTQIAIAAGDLVGAHASVDELDATAQAFDTTMLQAMTSLARGRVQLAEHDVEGACGSLREALRLWQELEVPYEVATTRTVLGQALREAGDEEGARTTFAAARALFDQIGARLDARGVDVDPDTHPLPGGLTEREAEVLRLIAAGMSNKEIAAALFLSV